MTRDDYSPFPEQELRELADFHDSVAAGYPERSYIRHVHTERATTCRNAILSHVALRDRCLESELHLGQARRRA
jgi:hypothetical protein